MNMKDAIQSFNMNSLKPTFVNVRHLDGTITKSNKYGAIIEEADEYNQPEPSFSLYGFIPNFNLDLQIGKINLPEFIILFGSLDVAQDLNLLKANNVTHVINLISNIAPNYFPQFFQYLSLLVYDDLSFQLHDTLYQCCDFLNIVREKEGCCFIHCNAGLSRAPSIVIAYLIIVYNYSYEEAYNLVNSTRNVCINVNFRSQLMRLS
ncbi:Dual specificity protein phosphatase 19 [Schistosoma japonicum]|uniref:Dual specificity protein phosphatase 19 n=1 Tax=Schistosoma japonicum TaxID=6182 RepID=Q5DFH9_SCHJA|nr:SJCHGC03666 protein [Schistosoma japonicum]KAH8877785.1 Protein-tyrosine-phosphatase MKP1 [Schistosoma japonicum]KAH8877786.1 Protein-tyrosine-phosphatase MKP1 [Schistosoma japonicum]KAH8877787.1 Protein-tyrosine-phosphatase MKP1 [Schistosoma japonicum]KAH8877788.1 Protein-tyrosine-phosphatase MKP1 [Schistosoma japonicum]